MYSGYGIGSVFDLINEILNFISLLIYSIFKFIYSFVTDIDYNLVSLEIITRYSKMKEDVVSVYNKNFDKNSFVNTTLEYACYCIEQLKSIALGYRIEPFNNNWVSISYVDQSEIDKVNLSFTFGEFSFSNKELVYLD